MVKFDQLNHTLKVPDVLISGNHKKIREWRIKESLKRTYLRRPDLLKQKEETKKKENEDKPKKRNANVKKTNKLDMDKNNVENIGVEEIEFEYDETLEDE